jgi:tRNA pseudouridine38-40 synthase
VKRHTYAVTIAYDGRAFASFAPVPGQRTVWSVVREALISVAPGFGRLASAGRTDRGVSATAQVFSFIARDPVECEVIAAAIDRAAPNELAALEVRRVSNSFHAQFSAIARRYVYFHEDDGSADVARIDRMLCALLGRRSFSAFARETPRDKALVKTLIDARARRVIEDGRSFVRFDFAGQAFLRRQVRVMVATVLREAAAGSKDEILVELAETEDRRVTANPAPAEGLYLVKVGYDPLRPNNKTFGKS